MSKNARETQVEVFIHCVGPYPLGLGAPADLSSANYAYGVKVCHERV